MWGFGIIVKNFAVSCLVVTFELLLSSRIEIFYNKNKFQSLY